MTMTAAPSLNPRSCADEVLTFERQLPGPISRVWAYLTDSALRRQWLAGGDTIAGMGDSFELVWRNDELSASAAERPPGFADVSRATCLLTALDPPHRLEFTWPGVGEVSIRLAEDGNDVRLTLTHRHCPDVAWRPMLCAGWHTHLDILAAKAQGATPPSFWATWTQLRLRYTDGTPA